ncbi:MAG TPA: hypothetical protein VIE43_16990 [Thermoanaerobaculia bacterium]|jgi:thiamine monophosphate kinase|nr:hypothetical protein [Thermoanaerobaculia bacterium]
MSHNRSRNRRVTLQLLAASLFAVASVTAPVHADDASCKPVVDALMAQAKASYHSTITANGKDGGEEIYTTTAIYRGHGGHWTKIPATPQDRVEANKTVGASASHCRQVRVETVDGQLATVYTAHLQTQAPASTAEMQMWIGKASGLPLKVESDVEMSGRKTHVSKHYAYGNVQAPAGVN